MYTKVPVYRRNKQHPTQLNSTVVPLFLPFSIAPGPPYSQQITESHKWHTVHEAKPLLSVVLTRCMQGAVLQGELAHVLGDA